MIARDEMRCWLEQITYYMEVFQKAYCDYSEVADKAWFSAASWIRNPELSAKKRKLATKIKKSVTTLCQSDDKNHDAALNRILEIIDNGRMENLRLSNLYQKGPGHLDDYLDKIRKVLETIHKIYGDYGAYDLNPRQLRDSLGFRCLQELLGYLILKEIIEINYTLLQPSNFRYWTLDMEALIAKVTLAKQVVQDIYKIEIAYSTNRSYSLSYFLELKSVLDKALEEIDKIRPYYLKQAATLIALLSGWFSGMLTAEIVVIGVTLQCAECCKGESRLREILEDIKKSVVDKISIETSRLRPRHIQQIDIGGVAECRKRANTHRDTIEAGPSDEVSEAPRSEAVAILRQQVPPSYFFEPADDSWVMPGWSEGSESDDSIEESGTGQFSRKPHAK